MSIQEILEEHVLEEIWNEFPTVHYNAKGEWNPFQFFMEADVDETDDVNHSPLKEWGYIVCEAYEWENVRSIRGLMQAKYNELKRLKSTLFEHAVKSVILSKDEFVNEEEFYEFAQKSNAILHRQGTDEYLTVLTVCEEALS